MPYNRIGSLTKRNGAVCAHSPTLVDNRKYYEWTANIRTDRFAVDGSFLVNIFIGEPSSSKDWTQDPTFVGTYGLFSKNNTCVTCKDQSLPAFIAAGTVPLTSALIACAKNGHIASLV